ncbi:MAG TPA: thioredoxin domain-containing protein [Terriglobales bacterium]|nr:thioredoxin domain-containing protein [Terriglobales bacterium]
MQVAAEVEHVATLDPESPQSLTVSGFSWKRVLSFISGLGMIVFSVLTIRHFFQANYPTSIYEGSFCDINSFFNCNSSAYSMIAAIAGVPLGYFGLFTGALVSMGALFPSAEFERTNKSIALLNVIGVVSLLLFSVFYLKSLCVLCSGYYLFSIMSFVLFWRYGIDGREASFISRYVRPSPKYLATFAVLMVAGAYGLRLYHDATKQAQSGGVASEIVQQYFNLPTVKTPSVVSPYWLVKSTEKFEDAPIQVIEYADFLCPDCKYLNEQLERLSQEFKGKINIAFQFFPLEKGCNTVVDKDKHPGACELALMAAHDPRKFQAMHHEIFINFESAKKPEWRRELSRRYGVEGALTDENTRARVLQIINTGAEYEKTSDKYAHGIRSTPTMIINNRMIIGTFPYEQLRAIFQALEQKNGKRTDQKFMENWQE